MKKLILLSIFTLFSFISVGQVNTDEYKNYKPCKECSTEQWRNSHSTGQSSNKSKSTGLLHSVGREAKNASRTIAVTCISIVTSIIGVLIYTKLNNATQVQ